VVLPLISIPYISRILDPEGIGRVGFIDSLTYYFVIIAEVGIMVYGIREVAKYKEDKIALGKLVSELLTLHLLSSLCVLVLYSISVFFLWNKIGDWRLVLFSFSFLVANSFACEWYYMGMEKFGFISLRSFLVRLLGLASVFLLIHQPTDYYLYYAIIAGAAIVGYIWNIAALFKEVSFSFKKANWKRHLKYVWVTYLISLLYSIPLMLDNVLLGLASTPVAVGLYAFSAKIVRTGASLLTDSFLVFFPRIVSLAKEKEEVQLQQKLVFSIQFIILLSVPMGVGLFLIADELSIVFLGNKFSTVADNLRILAFFPFLKGISLFLSNPVMIAHHKEKAFLKNLFAASFLFIGSALVLGYYYKDLGLCIALMCIEVVLIISNFISIRKILPSLKVFDLKVLLQAVAASLLFIPVIASLRYFLQTDWVVLVSAIMSCSFLYGILVWVFAKNEFIISVKQIVFSSFRKTDNI
jgi:O-antigen/teichoic acid export membrane protein